MLPMVSIQGHQSRWEGENAPDGADSGTPGTVGGV